MVETAINPDRWNCPYLKLECHADGANAGIADIEIEELCEARDYSECLLVNGGTCEVYERWLKERRNG